MPVSQQVPVANTPSTKQVPKKEPDNLPWASTGSGPLPLLLSHRIGRRVELPASATSTAKIGMGPFFFAWLPGCLDQGFNISRRSSMITRQREESDRARPIHQKSTRSRSGGLVVNLGGVVFVYAFGGRLGKLGCLSPESNARGMDGWRMGRLHPWPRLICTDLIESSV